MTRILIAGRIIVLLTIALMLPASMASAQSGGEYNLTWFTPDSGGLITASSLTYGMDSSFGQVYAGNRQSSSLYSVIQNPTAVRLVSLIVHPADPPWITLTLLALVAVVGMVTWRRYHAKTSPDRGKGQP